MTWVPGRSGLNKGRSLTLTYQRNGRVREMRVDPTAALVVGVLLLILGGWYLVATLYLIFRDDLLVGLVARQTQMQYAYEDRIGALRASIDRVTSRQVLDQDSLEGKLQDLAGRQALLETRQAMVASLAAQAETLTRGNTPPLVSAAGMAARTTPRPAQAATAPATGGVLPEAATAFAPAEKPHPAPDFGPLRGSGPAAAPVVRAESAPLPGPRASISPDRGGPVEGRLARLTNALTTTEATQMATLRIYESRARLSAGKLKSVFADLGLDHSRFAAGPVVADPQGGPYLPVQVDPKSGPFESTVDRLQKSLVEVDRMRRIVDALPLRRPLAGDPDTTSGFGYRIDPFTRGMALHSGIDFREEWGTPVRATAGGTIVSAEWTGGYGNMVEVDHGNGLTTRYGHLSQISVDAGRRIEAGTVIGKVGSTGRSTGPHLHYETRVDGEPVDPLRYLRAAASLAAP